MRQTVRPADAGKIPVRRSGIIRRGCRPPNPGPLVSGPVDRPGERPAQPNHRQPAVGPFFRPGLGADSRRHGTTVLASRLAGLVSHGFSRSRLRPQTYHRTAAQFPRLSVALAPSSRGSRNIDAVPRPAGPPHDRRTISRRPGFLFGETLYLSGQQRYRPECRNPGRTQRSVAGNDPARSLDYRRPAERQRRSKENRRLPQTIPDRPASPIDRDLRGGRRRVRIIPQRQARRQGPGPRPGLSLQRGQPDRVRQQLDRTSS